MSRFGVGDRVRVVTDAKGPRMWHGKRGTIVSVGDPAPELRQQPGRDNDVLYRVHFGHGQVVALWESEVAIAGAFPLAPPGQARSLEEESLRALITWWQLKLRLSALEPTWANEAAEQLDFDRMLRRERAAWYEHMKAEAKLISVLPELAHA
ncbi:MAG: hypothetical protein FJ315_05430 [SAR202 cluster bacterium]|nr:hypothetical protein [SAR202 cluster bacterium]